MSTVPQLEELEEGSVFRLANITHTFPPDSPKPLPVHFAPSSADKERALETGLPLAAVTAGRSRYPTRMTSSDCAMSRRVSVFSERTLPQSSVPWRGVYYTTIWNDSRPGA
jgi:hypothetical protein